MDHCDALSLPPARRAFLCRSSSLLLAAAGSIALPALAQQRSPTSVFHDPACLRHVTGPDHPEAPARHGVKRILIADWEVHHGNGTQDVFWSDGSVLFFDTHQDPWYPGTGHADEIGEGEGRTDREPTVSCRRGPRGDPRCFP
jgi:hypothetical protein